MQNVEPAEDLGMEPIQAEIQELDSEIKDLDDLLANASLEEEIVIEEL